ncbi:ECF transporter S component [Halanaerobacter jeridensis]|uniref:Membrane protein n=1 Tax=Halanaerobacter jeridensis TaxID=706427 RepID=A0A938XUM7_9FIRM|nr:ECF transporter S component [Halanaerobacter jeridensis]MBM7556631.1 putative membrane protein [Halanaerobacter jeridensis]
MNQNKKLALRGLMIALVTVATYLIRIPIPATSGYINAGDSMIFLASIVFGPQVGLIAGGLGSALADLLAGYAQYAPITLVVKGLEGWVVGKIALQTAKRAELNIKDIVAILVGGAVMVIGYYCGEAILFKSLVAPAAEIVPNIGQAIGSAVIALPLIYAILKTDIVEIINE